MAVTGMFMCLLVMLTSSLADMDKAIEIKIDPNPYNKIRNDAVHISCTPGGGYLARVNEVVFIEIYKDNTPVAVIKKPSQTSLITGDKERFKIAGHIDSDVSKSYFNLTIQNLQSSDSGKYSCVMFYLDNMGVLKDERDVKNMTEENLDTRGIDASLSFLHEKIRTLEMNSVEQNKVDGRLDDRVSALEQASENQTKKINALDEKAQFTVAFSVTSRYRNIKQSMNEALVLPDVLVEIGQAYNVSTGIFTAPRNGLYVFHLVVMTDPGCRLFTDLVKNGGALARLHAQDVSTFDQSSVSTVADLVTGDRVYALVNTGKCGVHEQMYSLFSGYLIKSF